ncbi:hypothetical protein L0F16_20685 [Klebsiella pneumoniae]|nr:hypothetical protein [Klebsiella pneumoniae]
MTDITELTSVQKNANIHRLSRLIAYAPNDELRQMAVEVEHYTDQLIEALEKAQQRISQLESRTVKLPKPKNSDQGWKIDPEFINKVQDAIGYDDTCECWEGTPSMELVEAVLLAAAGIKVGAE